MELIRRGLKTGDLAKAIGYKTDSLTNLLCGNMKSHAAQCRIEDFFGMPFWSKQEEFAARNKDKMNNPRFSIPADEASSPESIDPADYNRCHEWGEIIGKLGLGLVCVQVRPDWSADGESQLGESIGSELHAAGLGHCDSTQWHPKLRHFFYIQQSRLADALALIKSSLERRNALARCAIAHYDVGAALWRGFYPIEKKS